MEYLEIHPWNVSVQEAAEIQKTLRHQVSLVDGFTEVHLIAGIDVGVPAGTNEGHSVVVVLTYPGFEVVEVKRGFRRLDFPYIPGFLSFREIPAILSAIEKIEHIPDIIMVDGQGIAHPRGLGLAAHLGVLLDVPAMGCAKSRLYGTYTEPGNERGSISPMRDKDGVQIGNAIRTRTNTKPIFTSPGNKISIDSSTRITLDCTPKYRIPEPTRIAHQLASVTRDAYT